MVYSLTDAEGSVMYGWGDLGDPLRPIRGVPEGKAIVAAVRDGRLRLTDVLGVPINRLDAARVVNALSGKKKPGGPGKKVAVWGHGKPRYFPSIIAAAKALGMSERDLHWQLHRLKTILIFHKRSKLA